MSAPRRPLPAWAEIAALPLINIALAFVTVGIIVRIIGVDPFHALRLLVVGAIGSSEGIGYTLYYTTNFIFTDSGHHAYLQLKNADGIKKEILDILYLRIPTL